MDDRQANAHKRRVFGCKVFVSCELLAGIEPVFRVGFIGPENVSSKVVGVELNIESAQDLVTQLRAELRKIRRKGVL